jgi:hypothetical protein
MASGGISKLLRSLFPARYDAPGRNDPCWCGSGKKYKRCHLQHDQVKRAGTHGRGGRRKPKEKEKAGAPGDV